MENTQTGAGQSISAGCVTGRYYKSCGKPHGFADWRSPMNGLLKLLSAVAMAAVFAGRGMAADRPAPPAVKSATPPLLSSHCLKCHGPDDANGGFRLDTLPVAIDSIEAAERWQQVLNVLNSGEMPPDDEKQIEAAAKADLLDDLAHVVVTARKTLADSGGAVTMRRLNRREYANTLRDLLGVEIDVRELPADVQAGGFDTVGSGLFVSADQIEQYHSLGMIAVDEAWKRYGGTGKVRKVHVEAEEGTTAKVRKSLDKRLEAREKFLEWKRKVEEAAAKPENQAVVAAIRAAAPKDPDALFKASDRLQDTASPKDYGWTDAIHAFHEGEGWWKLNVPHHKAYATHPAVDSGALLSVYDVYVHPYQSFNIPGDWPPGEYVLRLRVAALDDAPPQRRFIEYGRRTQENYGVEGCRRVNGTLAEPQILEIPVSITTGGSRGFWIYEKGIHDTNEKAHRFYFDAHGKNGVGPSFAIWIDWIEAEGPLNADQPPPPALAELLTVPPVDKPGATKPSAEEDIRGALERFALRAFRGRQPEAGYVDRLVAIFRKHREAGKPFREAVKEPLATVLSSPHFLYLAEPLGEQDRRKLDDLELASRLSYFLWSSPPDDVLLEAAKAGELQTPEGRTAQVDRMLADLRSRDFVTAFTQQWLGLERLDFFQFNDRLYPEYDLATKALSKQEIFETIGLLIRENGSLKNLLTSDFVVVNGVLAQYYGLEGVSGDEFQKVKLPADSPRGGLLGMAAVMAMGSNGEHTSAVERGAWVLRKLLHDPPPPAPPNVPQLTRLEGKLLTSRERLRLHQEEPQCASCHRRIDPIGFGLENFDAAGRWRTEDSYVKDGVGTKTWKIEPAGALHGGPEFKDFYELREIIASRPDDFATGFTEALLEYALGRPVGFSDEELVKAIVKRAADKDYSAREFIHAVVQSRAFRTK
jgi:mono/diheme cytochrome c family protein